MNINWWNLRVFMFKMIIWMNFFFFINGYVYLENRYEDMFSDKRYNLF